MTFHIRCTRGDRKFNIVNMCSFTLWPTVTNFQGAEFAVYDKGKRGWEAPPGHRETIVIPEKWNGRIGIRRGCTGQGKNFKCLMADTPGGLEPELFVLTPSNLGEFNLAGWQDNDFWDISYVPGIVAPMSIEPHHHSCTKVICAQNVIERCPNELAVQDPETGEILGCRSACMAGVNAKEPSLNCCSGKYNSMEACHSEKIDHYEFFKSMCPLGYAAPYDMDPRLPNVVDYVCPSKERSDYTITFCPAGDGKPKTFEKPDVVLGKEQNVGNEDKPKEKHKEEKEEKEDKEDTTKDKKPENDAKEDKPTEDANDPITATKPRGGTTTTTTTATDTTTTSKASYSAAEAKETAADAGSTAAATHATTADATTTSDQSGIGDFFAGIQKTTWYWIGGGALLFVLLTVALCIVCCRNKGRKYERAPSEDAER
ncbi:hypothetical protein OIV83_000772 [Microbotryomycetes sp. JL201]|nr:hypothetical protein OIV83_000772 [Microbotryomycetes sp. JL201]